MDIEAIKETMSLRKHFLLEKREAQKLRKPDDFLIATGKTYNLKKLILLFLTNLNIKNKVSIISNKKFKRKNEILSNNANINKLYQKFKLKPKISSLEVMNKIYKNKYF